MRQTILILLLTLANVAAWGSRRLPPWMNELPRPGNGTYLYVRESGEGPTLAHNTALLRVMQSTAHRLGRPFDAQAVDQALGGGDDYRHLSRHYNIPIRKVDQYDEQLRDGTYRVWVLCQVAVSGTVQPQWDDLARQGESGNWTSLAKSLVVPGLGQMGKGYRAEGWLTLGGELLLAGAGAGSYLLAQQQLATLRDAATPYPDWNTARLRYNTLQTLSYAAWGSAAVLYAFNLYRAFAMQPKRATGLACAPALLPAPGGLAPGLSLTIKLQTP